MPLAEIAPGLGSQVRTLRLPARGVGFEGGETRAELRARSGWLS